MSTNNVSHVLSSVRKMDIHKISVNLALEKSQRYTQKYVKYATARIIIIYLKSKMFRNAYDVAKYMKLSARSAYLYLYEICEGKYLEDNEFLIVTRDNKTYYYKIEEVEVKRRR